MLGLRNSSKNGWVHTSTGFNLADGTYSNNFETNFTASVGVCDRNTCFEQYYYVKLLVPSVFN